MALFAQPVVLGFAVLACTASHGHATPSDKPDVAKILGTYECHTGSSAGVTVDRAPEIKQTTPSDPALRITFSSLDEKSELKLLRWQSKEKTWSESRHSIKLWVRKTEFKDAYWAVLFEGGFGGSIFASAMLTNLPGASTRAATPSDKPVFALTQFASYFASAGIYACDKLEK